MTAREWRYALLLVAAVGLAVVVPWLQPTPVDWSDSFEHDDTRPFGSRVLFEHLPSLFPDADTIRPVATTPYLWLQDRTPRRSAYLFVTTQLHLDPTETRSLLEYAARGNTVFVAAQTYEGPLADSLNLETSLRLDVGAVTDAVTDSGRTKLRLSADNLTTAEGYPVRRGSARLFLTSVDTARTTILGTAAGGDPTLVRTRRGEGYFLISTTPRVFTNYHILERERSSYVWPALSHLPSDRRAVWWDARHKPDAARSQTVMRFVLSDPALRMAYWLLLVGAVLFVVTRGRRRQRPVPVEAPPRNRMLEFVRQVGRLYHDRGRPLDLARKKIEHLRTHLRRLDLPPGPPGSDWVERVARRTGVPRADVEALADAIEMVDEHSSLSSEELKTLDERLDAFYDQMAS